MIPAYCPTCRAVFDSHLLGGVGRIKGLSLKGNVTECPLCKGRAPIIEGEFNWSPDSLEVLRAEPWTADVLAKLKEVLERATDPSQDRDEVIKDLESVAPEAAKQLAEVKSAPHVVWAFVAMLILVAVQQCAVNIDASIDLNQALEQVSRLLAQPGDAQDSENRQQSPDGTGTSPNVDP